MGDGIYAHINITHFNGLQRFFCCSCVIFRYTWTYFTHIFTHNWQIIAATQQTQFSVCIFSFLFFYNFLCVFFYFSLFIFVHNFRIFLSVFVLYSKRNKTESCACESRDVDDEESRTTRELKENMQKSTEN